jgi:hypothetical protein
VAVVVVVVMMMMMMVFILVDMVIEHPHQSARYNPTEHN